MKTKNFLKRIGSLATIILVSFTGTIAAQHPLDSWVRRPISAPNVNLSSVAFGNGVFVAVGDGSTVARSSDGIDWTVSTPGVYGNLTRVRFLAGEFVAVGTSDKILFSADGASWLEGTLPSASFWDVAHGNGMYVVAGVTSYVSSNATDWAVTVPRSGGLPLDSIEFGNGRFVGLPGGSTLFQRRPSVYSTNGVNWDVGGDAPTTQVAGSGDLLFADGLFLGTGFDISQVSGVMVTSDGATWCCRFGGGAGPNNHGAALAYGQGHFLWVQQPYLTGSEYWPFIYSSTNGTAWVNRFARPGLLPPGDPAIEYYQSMKGQVNGAAFGNGSFVAVGNDGVGGSYVIQSGNVGGVPTLLQQPQDRGAVVGNPASFSVQAVGAPPLAYQWYFNSNTIANATNSTYSISSVVAGNGGAYHVVVTNSFGSVTSRVAQLTVAFLDISSYAGVKVFGVPGRTYRIEASPSSGTPTWQTVTNLVLPSSPYIWIDYESPTLPTRIYRAAELP